MKNASKLISGLFQHSWKETSCVEIERNKVKVWFEETGSMDRANYQIFGEQSLFI